jgi:hypothetical protein
MDYPQWLERAGFKVEAFDMNEKWEPTEVESYRLMKKEILYIAKKP